MTNTTKTITKITTNNRIKAAAAAAARPITSTDRLRIINNNNNRRTIPIDLALIITNRLLTVHRRHTLPITILIILINMLNPITITRPSSTINIIPGELLLLSSHRLLIGLPL